MSARLNPAQRKAIEYLEGPCLVLAGAGSGKTQVITRKIVHLIRNCGFDPANIGAITFTNKAAKEMQERVAHLLGGVPSGLTVCTFHALGVRIIRQEARHCGLKPQFSILDSGDALQIVSDAVAQRDKAFVKQVQWQISAWKSALLTPEEASRGADNDIAVAAAHAYGEYERILRAYHAVDFDDLIALPVKLFQTEEDVKARWQRKLRYLLVDEYQDTNGAQYALLRLLTGVKGAFTAVGDDNQAIYAWRGADIENLRTLQQDYPALHVIKLEQNYRSSQRILEAANRLIAHNEKLFDKRLWSEHGQGDYVSVTDCRDPEQEAEWIATRISAHKFQHRTRFRDYAILYRSNHQARVLEQQLRNQRIPYVISGGQSFFERAEIRDLIAYLRLLMNEDDDLAFIRSITTPRRGIGATSMEALGRYAAIRHRGFFACIFEQGVEAHLSAKPLEAMRTFGAFIRQMQHRARSEPAGLVIETLLSAIHYEAWLYEHADAQEAGNRWSNVRDFVDWLSRRAEQDGKNLIELAQSIALITMLDKNDAEQDAVQLATLHASKGLEFPHVFLAGVEEGLLPHQNSIDEDKIEEERRLMYVGITRAQRSLTLTWCERRKAGKDFRRCEASRFIPEMGKDIDVRDRKNPEPVGKDEGRARIAQLWAVLENKKD